MRTAHHLYHLPWWLLLLVICLPAITNVLPCAAQTQNDHAPIHYRRKSLIFTDDFSSGFDSTVWIRGDPPAPASRVAVEFGFRATWSRQRIEDVRIYQLE